MSSIEWAANEFHFFSIMFIWITLRPKHTKSIWTQCMEKYGKNSIDRLLQSISCDLFVWHVRLGSHSSKYSFCFSSFCSVSARESMSFMFLHNFAAFIRFVTGYCIRCSAASVCWHFIQTSSQLINKIYWISMQWSKFCAPPFFRKLLSHRAKVPPAPR